MLAVLFGAVNLQSTCLGEGLALRRASLALFGWVVDGPLVVLCGLL